MKEITDLSIIIPAYNEEKNVLPLYNQLKQVLDSLKKTYEIIVIDDGSTDGTFNELKRLHENDNSVKVIQFQKNFGKSAALSAGFSKAIGNVIVTLDADLQDDPTEIPNFLNNIKDNDLVIGWRHKRKDTLFKKLPSKLFNLFVRFFTKVKVHDSNCCFKAFKREVIENIKVYGELHRYIPTLANWEGYKISEIKVKHNPRRFGKSKYGFGRLSKGFFDLITVIFLRKYAKSPLHLFGLFGLACVLLGLVIGVHLVLIQLSGGIIGNRPLLILSVLLIVLGVQFVTLGLIGEMIISQQDKKTYTIKNKLN